MASSVRYRNWTSQFNRRIHEMLSEFPMALIEVQAFTTKQFPRLPRSRNPRTGPTAYPWAAALWLWIP